MSNESQYPFNVAGMQFFDMESISVHEWTPLPDGKGSPEQVHLCVQMAGWEHPMVMRFKSAATVDALIVALITHRNRVWGKIETSAVVGGSKPEN